MRISDWSSDVCSSDLYSLLDARLGLNRIGGTNINASVFAKNITNEAYAVERQALVSAFGFAGTIYNDPRTYGLEISYKFGGSDSRAWYDVDEGTERLFTPEPHTAQSSDPLH